MERVHLELFNLECFFLVNELINKLDEVDESGLLAYIVLVNIFEEELVLLLVASKDLDHKWTFFRLKNFGLGIEFDHV